MNNSESRRTQGNKKRDLDKRNAEQSRVETANAFIVGANSVTHGNKKRRIHQLYPPDLTAKPGQAAGPPPVEAAKVLNLPAALDEEESLRASDDSVAGMLDEMPMPNVEPLPAPMPAASEIGGGFPFDHAPGESYDRIIIGEPYRRAEADTLTMELGASPVWEANFGGWNVMSGVEIEYIMAPNVEPLPAPMPAASEIDGRYPFGPIGRALVDSFDYTMLEELVMRAEAGTLTMELVTSPVWDAIAEDRGIMVGDLIAYIRFIFFADY